VDSYRRNEAHQAMSASMYGNPHNRGAVVNLLDAMILGAAEIDLDFNVNVTTGTDGIIIGGSGGHADCAAGAKLALVTTRLSAGGYSKVVERVTTVTTPGDTVDALVTEEGVAVNPKRAELHDRLRSAGLPVVTIEELKESAEQRTSKPESRSPGEQVVAVVEYRDGTVIDVVHAVDPSHQVR
jgi:citrate lyase subunit alpha/citrate CoA-transferase